MGYEVPRKVSSTLTDTDFLIKSNVRNNKTERVPVSALRNSMLNLVQKTPVNAVAASGVVTFSGTPVANEKLTIGTQEFTFKATRAVAFEITINANNTTQGDNLVTAITADLTNVTAVNSTGTVTITAAVKGAAGNNIALSEAATGTAVSSVTGGKLDGGIDGTVGAANELCTDDTYLYVALAANTVADNNWRRIALGSVY